MDLTDEQWEVLEPLIPDPPRREDGRVRPPAASLSRQAAADPIPVHGSHLSDDPGGDFSIGVATAMCPRLYRLVCEALRTSENRPYSINYTSSVAGPGNAGLRD